MGLEAEILTVIGHQESGAKSGQEFGLNFGDVTDDGKRRATLQFAGEIPELVGGGRSRKLPRGRRRGSSYTP